MSEKQYRPEQWVKIDSKTGKIEGRVTQEQMEEETKPDVYQDKEDTENNLSN